MTLSVSASGPNLRLASGVPALLQGEPESGTVDAHGIQAFYTGLIARASGLDVKAEATPEMVTVIAAPAARQEEADLAAPAPEAS